MICYPLIFSSTEFYISHDLALLTDHIRTDINFISRRWRLRGRPTYCIIITEANFKDHQFSEMLALLMEIRSELSIFTNFMPKSLLKLALFAEHTSKLLRA